MRTALACMFLFILTSLVRADDAAKSDLGKTLGALAAQHEGKIAIAFKHLPSGETYFLNADTPMKTASLIKLPIMIEAFKQAGEGKFKLTDPVVLKEEDKVIGSGVLTQHFTTGLTFPLIDAINLMIAHSDNTATNLVLDKIGIGATGERMKSLGFVNTRGHHKVFKGDTTSIDPARSKQFGLGSTTAREMVGILEMLDQGKLADEKSTKQMIEILKKCEDIARFPRFLKGVAVAHKTGSLDEVRTDAGLLYFKEGPVALCVLTDQNKDKSWTVDNAGSVVCAKIAKEAVDYCKKKYGTAAPAAAKVEAPKAAPEASGELAKTLEAIAAKHQGKIAIAYKHLPSGETFFLNGDTPMPTASLIKLPVMIEVYHQAKEGKIKLTDPVVLKEEDKVPGSGILKYHFSGGATFPLLDAVDLMIAYSDNTATNLVLDKIGLPATAERMKQLGFPNTRMNSKVFKGSTTIDKEQSRKYGLGSTTARDMITLLEMIDQNKLVDEKSCKEMLGMLKKCEDKLKFPRHLKGVTVAHKTGSVNSSRTDAGLLYFPEGPVALCVLTDENKDRRWTDDNAGDAVCAEVAKAVVDYCKAKHKPAPKTAASAGKGK